MANRVDLDQMLHSAVSDLGLHCLQRPIGLNIHKGCPIKIFLMSHLLEAPHRYIGYNEYPQHMSFNVEKKEIGLLLA